MEQSPEVTGYIASLLRDEFVLRGIFLLIGGVVTMIGTLLFGRGYKKRMALIEAKVADIDKINAALAVIESAQPSMSSNKLLRLADRITRKGIVSCPEPSCGSDTVRFVVAS